MYNKKALSKASAELDKAKAPKKPKDIINDPMGQWKYPGLPTRIPSNDITMKGVGYPVLGVANNGQRKIMLPGAEYTFPGADYVDEYPQMRKGGTKKKTRSLSGTNKIMLTHPLLKNYKNKVYDPNAEYFQDGGEKDTIIYPPGDSEYMDQPSYNYDIIEMLNQKARRNYEQYMHDQTDPTNINRTSPAYQQKFQMREGQLSAQKGGAKKTHKSKDGTVTNRFINEAGDEVVQVKTKDGKYSEKIIPNNKYISPLTGKPYVPMQGDATIPSGWEAEDNTLEDIAEFIDPTGITSWDDVRRAYDENGLFDPKTGLEILGALPLIGKIGKSGKILAGGEKLFLDAVKYFGYNDKIANAYNAYRKLGGKNLDKVLGLTTKALTKLSPKLNPEKWESSMKLINALNKFTEGAKATKLFPYLPSGDTQTKNDEEYVEAELTDDEIEEYRRGGYIVEDISVPELNQAKEGGSQICPDGYIFDPNAGDNGLCVPESMYKYSNFKSNPKQKEKEIEENKKFRESYDYMEEYYNSPKYKEMLKKSSKNDDTYNYFLKSRNKQLQNTPPLKLLPQPLDDPSIGGQSVSETGEITIFPQGIGTEHTSEHELSHSSDRPLPGKERRLIPQKDIDYINKHKPKNTKDNQEYKDTGSYYDNEKFYNDYYRDYVAYPTETRARLNSIRKAAKDNKLYDPFTEGVSPDTYYKKLKNFKFEKGDKEGFDPMNHLKNTFTDDEIIWMLNNISKKDDTNTDVPGGLTQAQKGIISTKEHTDKKGNKTIKVRKEDGTVYTKVIGKDGKVFNKTFDPKKDSWATEQTKNLYSKAQGAGNSDWFWAPAALTAIGAAPLIRSGATALGEGLVGVGDAVANATLNKLGKNSFLQATKAAYNAAPSWLPGASVNNFLTGAGAAYGTAEFLDKDSDVRKSYSKVAEDPTLGNVGNAVSETGLNMLDFLGLGLGNKALSAPKYLKKLGKLNKVKSNKVLDDVIDVSRSNETIPALAKTNTEYRYGMHPDNPYRQNNVRTYSKEETELLEKNLPENLKTEKVDNWAYVPEELRTREAQTKAFNEATEVNDRWVYTDPKKFKELEDIKDKLKLQAGYTMKEFEEKGELEKLKSPLYEDFFKHKAMSVKQYFSKKYNPSSAEDVEEIKKIDDELEEFVNKNLESNPKFKELQPKVESIEKQKDLIKEEIKKIASEQDKLIDPLFKSKVNNILHETNNPSRLTSLDYSGEVELPHMRDPKLVHVDEQSMMDLPDYDKDFIKENLNKIAGVNTKNNTITLASQPNPPVYYKKLPEKKAKLLEPKTWLNAFKKNNTNDLDDQELIKYIEQKMIDPTFIGEVNIHELGHDNQKYKNWLRGLADMDPTTGYVTKKGDSKLAKEFEEAMVEPTKLEKPGDSYSTESWQAGVNELHSDLQIARLKAVKNYMKEYNLSVADATSLVKNLESEGSDELYDFYITVKDVNNHFKNTTSNEVKRKLLKVFPAVVPAAFSIGALNKEEEKAPRRFKKGGVVTELSDDEIQDYINQGYIVEEVDEPEMQSGGQLPYKIWEEKTGTPWSEAKRQGLTDGSYEQNVALAQKLLADATSVVKENLESKPTFDYNKYDQIVSTLVQKGNTLEDLVAQQIGTKEGLMKRYPNLFSASNSKSKAVNTANIPVRSVDEILKRTAAPVNLKTPDSRMKSETIQYQNIPVKKLNLISDSNLKPKPVNNTVKQFEKSKQVNQTKLKEAELKNYVNAIRDSLTPDSIKKQKQLQNSFFPTAPKKKLTVKEPLTQESTQEFKARMLKIQQGLNLKPIVSDTEKIAPIKNFQDLQGEPGKFDIVSPNLPEVNGKQFPVKKPVVKAKPPQDITKFQNTLKPEISFKKGSKITEVKPETEEKVVKEDSGYKVISNLTNRMGSYDQSLQNLYYDYTNPKHSPEKRKQVKAAFDNKLKERNNLVTTINSKKRDYAGVLDSWIDESAPAWIKKPAQKYDLSDQVEATSYKLPKLETYKEKEEKENEKFRTTKRFDDLGGNEKGSRWQFRVAASNDDPMKVQVYGTRAERNPDLNIKSKGAVMHFLDQSPLTGYMHPLTKDYYNNLKPDGFVGKLEKQKDGNFAVKYVPKKDIPAKDLHKNTFLVRQEKFDNIDFNKKVADDNFPGHTYWTKKGSTKATIPVSSGKDPNVYDYSSGQSVVFIFPYKGKTRYVHYAGSPNAIKKEGEEIKKLYKLQPNKLVLGVADAGSYSSSVKGNITDKKLKDWNYGYANKNSFTGAGMALVD